MNDASYIHGTATSEQARLAQLNRLTNRPFLEFLRVESGSRVLDVGSGLGILAAEVAASALGVLVTGLERSPAQIAVATQHQSVNYVEGDAHQLPFEEGTFDVVYCRYLLEHVKQPEQVVAEMRRVTRPGGSIAVMENDTSLVRFDPPCPAFQAVWSVFSRYQWQLGGDAFIGRRLYRLLQAAGWTQIELSLQPEVHWSGSPDFGPWIDNLLGNLDSVRAGLIEAAVCTPDQIALVEQELKKFANRTDATALFAWNRARGVK